MGPAPRMPSPVKCQRNGTTWLSPTPSAGPLGPSRPALSLWLNFSLSSQESKEGGAAEVGEQS